MIVFPIILFAPLVAAAVFQLHLKIGRNSIAHSVFQVLDHLVPIFVVLCSTLYTFLVSSAIEPLNCMRTDNGSTNPIYVMISSPSFRCYDGKWNNYLPLVVCCCFLYGLLLPFAMGYILITNRRKLDDQKFLSRYKTLYRSFRRVYFFWELILMFKKACFIIVVRFLSSRPTISYETKFASSVSIIGFFLALEALMQPYAQKSTNFRSST
jgi:hypothetical protein